MGADTFIWLTAIGNILVGVNNLKGRDPLGFFTFCGVGVLIAILKLIAGR